MGRRHQEEQVARHSAERGMWSEFEGGCHGPSAFLRSGALCSRCRECPRRLQTRSRSCTTWHVRFGRIWESWSRSLLSTARLKWAGLVRRPARTQLVFLSDFSASAKGLQEGVAPACRSRLFRPPDMGYLRGDLFGKTPVGLGHQDRQVDKLQHEQVVATIAEGDGANASAPSDAVKANQRAHCKAFVVATGKMPEAAAFLNRVAALVRQATKIPNSCGACISKDEWLAGFPLLGHASFSQREARGSGHGFRGHLVKPTDIDAGPLSDLA